MPWQKRELDPATGIWIFDDVFWAFPRFEHWLSDDSTVAFRDFEDVLIPTKYCFVR